MTYDINWSVNQTMGDFFSSIGQNTGYWELALVFEFFLILITGAALNKKSVGVTNLGAWIQISLIAVFFTALFLTMGEFIPATTLTIVIAITLVSIIIIEVADRTLGDIF